MKTGEILKRWREELGLSQTEAAQFFEANEHTYRAWEMNRRRVSPSRALRMEQATLGAIKADDLLQHLAPKGYRLEMRLTAQECIETDNKKENNRSG